MTSLPCDIDPDDPQDIRQAVLATVHEAKQVAARPGTPRSMQLKLAAQVQEMARKNSDVVSPSTLYRAAREIKGRRG